MKIDMQSASEKNNSLSPAPRFLVFFLITGFLLPIFTMAQTYTWKNVAIGGGGFVTGIITNKSQANLIYCRTDVGGAYRWDAVGGRWISLLDWVSENEVGYLGVESMATDPVEPDNVYMLLGTSYFNSGKTAILRSRDRGNTFKLTEVTSLFKAHGNGMGRQTGEKLVVDPNSNNILFCGTRRDGLFVSIDSAESWNKVQSFPVTTTTNDNGISFVVMDPSTGSSGSATQTMIIGVSRSGNSNLYRTNDGGQNFSPVPGAPTTLIPQRAVLAGDGTLYIVYANGVGPYGTGAEPMDAGQIWKYHLQTGVWTNITPSGFSRSFGGISVDPANPARIVASSVSAYLLQDNAYGDRIFLSTTGGSSWRDVVAGGFDITDNGIPWINGHSIHWAGCVEFDPFDTKKAWIISGNGVFRTDDIDAAVNSWKFQVKGLEETVPLNAISLPNGPMISVIGDYDGFRHADATQYSPIHEPRMGTTTGIAYAELNSKTLLRIGSKMFYSQDMGQTWAECSKNGNAGSVAISATGNIFLHSPENSSVTYRSINRGISWTAVTGLSFNNARPVADPVDSTKFYAYDPGGAGMLYVSSNGGISFLPTVSPGGNGSRIIRVVPGLQGHLWIALYNGGLKRSTNAGLSFSTISNISYCGAVGIGKAAAGSDYPTIFIWGTVNGTLGIHRSIDQGISWTRVNDDAHEYGGPGNGQFVIGDMNVFGRVYMSTAGRGIIYGETDQTCIPTNIIPFIKINNASAQQLSLVAALAGNNVLLTPSPATGGSWSWKGPAGFTASTREINLSNIQVSQAGIYTATYTDVNGCTSAPQPFTLNIAAATSIVNTAFNASLNIYPNPAPGGRFTIKLPGYDNVNVAIEIFSPDGKLVFQRLARSNSNMLTIDTGLRQGAYLLKIRKKNLVGAKKITVF